MQGKNPSSRIGGFFSGVGRGIELILRVGMTALFVSAFLILMAAYVSGRPKVPSKSALVLEIQGDIVEQLSARSPRDLLSGSTRGPRKETLLKDLLDVLKAAKTDDRIKALFVDVDGMGSAGVTKLQDLRMALLDFKKSGKKIIACADAYEQAPYYAVSVADEIYLNPEGMVFLEGFARYRMYYKDAIDRIGLEWNVFRVGEYKSAVEPYLRNDMSPEAKEADLDWMGDLWRSFVDDLASARKKKPEEITALIESFPERVKAEGGNTARLALKEKLVDKLAHRDEFRKRMIELVGEDKEIKSFNQVGFEEYLRATGGDRKGIAGKGDAVAVIVAKGEILDGTQPAGTVGGDSTAKLIRKAREDDTVKAIVLRVDSPGGSAFASEVIRREFELARQAKKPVVVSMGTVAASGGYWIATSSDEIWANPNTITGSIGIFGMFPTYGKALAQHLGIHVDGVGTTATAGMLRPDRPLDPRAAETIQAIINNGYEEFLIRVATARKMKREDVDKIARGRVWSGIDAQKAGLVDKLGSLEDAIASAAKRAKLPKDYRVMYMEKDLGFKDRLIRDLLARGVSLATQSGWIEETGGSRPTAAARVMTTLSEEVDRLAAWNDPRGVYAHCLCEVK